MSTARDFHLTSMAGSGAAHSVYTAMQRDMVKEQLERILASSLFRNSKRFPEFLRYTVNHALAGETEGLKERTLGVAVFGRHADYDTSTDPVVRVTAAEVRKRIAQYYETPGHEREPRIEFERGSYVPEFRFLSEEERREKQAATPAKIDEKRLIKKHWLPAACITVVSLAVCVFLLGSTRQTALDRFWKPVLSSGDAALLCIPDQLATPGRTAPIGPESAGGASTQIVPNGFHSVVLGDSVALAEVSGILGHEGKEFRVRATDDATLDDLKQGPVVLIGAFDNEWTMRLASGLRFTFGHDATYHFISDVRNPASRQWAVRNEMPSDSATVDYGLISRVVDTTTGRAVVTVAGIHHFGTEAAAECISQIACMEAAAKLAPGNWKKNNLQIVLKTAVIARNSGEPQVLAAYAW
jgi:hypothetical protein